MADINEVKNGDNLSVKDGSIQSDKMIVMKMKNELEMIIDKQSSTNHTQLTKLLEEICKLDVHLEILKETKIGVTLHRVKKEYRHTEPDIARQAADIVSKWKAIATDEFKASASPPGALTSPKKRALDDRHKSNDAAQSDSSSTSLSKNNHRSPNSSNANDDCPGEDDAKEPREKQRSASIQSSSSSLDDEHDAAKRRRMSSETDALSPTATTDDEVRRKSTEMIESALRSHKALEKLSTKPDVYEIANAIENAIFDEFKETDRRYRSKVRSRVSNLMDKRNDELRRQILMQEISCCRVAEMSVDELANDSMKRLKERISVDLEHEHDLPVDATSPHTDLYTCGECKAKDASYGTVEQTTDGDYEPSTVTLLFCNKCGHRWKNV